MQEALALVRQELGSQAAVLHTREVRSRGLARLWGGGELIEVVASDNVSVPGRLPDPYLNAREPATPHAPTGIDLTEIASPREDHLEMQVVRRSRAAAYLEQGLRPLVTIGENHKQFAHARGGAPLLLVCGASGVGATTVSWKLAQALAGQGRRAVWVDADLTSRRCTPAPNHREGSLADVLTGRRTVHEVLTLGADGVQCVHCTQHDRSISLSEADAIRCVRQLKGLSPHAEVVIVDAGSETNLLGSQLWRAANAVCVVVTPADEAILGGYAKIKKHRQHARGIELVLIVNRAEQPEAECVSQRLARACRQFLKVGLKLAGNLPTCNVRSAGSDLETAAERLWESLDPREHSAHIGTASTQNL